jgi:hypothetical protein
MRSAQSEPALEDYGKILACSSRCVVISGSFFKENIVLLQDRKVFESS